MCTSVYFKAEEHYFGRNLDLEHSYNEKVIITPRNYPFKFRHVGAVDKHYAMIGMGITAEDYPLYFDAVNECGLGMAGLNFPGNAVYCKPQDNKDNVATFELIQWLLASCRNIEDVCEMLDNVNILDTPFNDMLPVTPLHWMISDRDKTIVLESVKEGLRIYDNPTGVLTNNPAFDMQMFNLNNYMHLSTQSPVNYFSDKLIMDEYCRGMGAIGMPGDLSSQSRFIKAAFTNLNATAESNEEENVNQFFHILTSVEQQRGCVRVGDEFEMTIYSSCCNMDKGMYYYTTYMNRCINGVDMHAENLEGKSLTEYSLIKKNQINIQNQF